LSRENYLVVLLSSGSVPEEDSAFGTKGTKDKAGYQDEKEVNLRDGDKFAVRSLTKRVRDADF
jgi:hypothetical protein